MRRSGMVILGLLAASSGCTVAWKTKYFGAPPAESEEREIGRWEVQRKLRDNTTVRLGYARKYAYRPGGYRSQFEFYRIFDDSDHLIGRIDPTGETFRYTGPRPEDYIYLGQHELTNSLKLLFNLSAKDNVFLSEIDPYRGE